MRLYDPVGAMMVAVAIWRAGRSGEPAAIRLEDGELLRGRVVTVGRHVKLQTPTGPAWLPWRDIAEVRRDG